MSGLNRNSKVLIAGAGGFMGGHLTGDLLRRGFRDFRCVDIKPLGEWSQVYPEADNIVADLSTRSACRAAVGGAPIVFNLACQMGGLGYIEHNKAECMLSVLVNTHLLQAAQEQGIERFLFASSACAYNCLKQTEADPGVLMKEEDVYPAFPMDGYGWEKLFSERMCRHFREDFRVPTRIARIHNVYGPHSPYDGGREKAPMAICRKVIAAKLSGDHQIEIWGDGLQVRSFTYIDDAIEGTYLTAESDRWDGPVNIGSAEGVTINQLVDLVEEIAGIRLKRIYNLDAPRGVNGRNSDNTLVREVLGWEPTTSLRDGLERTYRWVHDQMRRTTARPVATPVTR